MVAVLLASLWLCACEPCQSISAQEACERITTAMEAACGKAEACAALYDPSAPFARCATDDRYCAADIDDSVEQLKAAKDCAAPLKTIKVNCFPE